MNQLVKIAAGSLFAVLVHTQANAAVVSFTSDGKFSNITNCGGSPTCSISDLNGLGSQNQLNMSGQNQQGLPSTLTANHVDTTFNVLPNQNDVVIGSLTWVNRATSGTDQNFNVNYTFTLNFTSPTVQSDFSRSPLTFSS